MAGSAPRSKWTGRSWSISVWTRSSGPACTTARMVGRSATITGLSTSSGASCWCSRRWESSLRLRSSFRRCKRVQASTWRPSKSRSRRPCSRSPESKDHLMTGRPETGASQSHPTGRRASIEGKLPQDGNRHGDDVGASPRGRNSYRLRRKLYGPGEQVADHRDDLAGAIEDGRPRRTMIEHKAIVSVIHLEQRRSGQPATVAVLHESAAHDAQTATRIREAHNGLLGKERFQAEPKGLCAGKPALQFNHGDLFGIGPRETLDTSGN